MNEKENTVHNFAMRAARMRYNERMVVGFCKHTHS